MLLLLLLVCVCVCVPFFKGVYMYIHLHVVGNVVSSPGELHLAPSPPLAGAGVTRAVG